LKKKAKPTTRKPTEPWKAKNTAGKMGGDGGEKRRKL
jgi:hypothetical protein